MRVSFNNLLFSNNHITFESAKARKLIETVKNAQKIDKLKITFEELEIMYKEIGYDIFYKRGSHAVIHINDKINLPVVIPHKKNIINNKDIKRFKYILEGDIQKAIDLSIHI